MKLHSIRVSTSACTRAYATSRLYSTLVLYRNISKFSRPAERKEEEEEKTTPFGVNLREAKYCTGLPRL